MKGPTLGTYDDIEIISLEGFTGGTADIKFDGLLLLSRIISVDGLKLRTE